VVLPQEVSLELKSKGEIVMRENVRNALNEQIKKEFESAYLYLSMSAFFESLSLEGMAQWMKVQAKEEIEHGMRIFEHLKDRGERIELFEISKPKKEWKSPLEAFEEAYEHEKYITKSIDKVIEVARAEEDNATLVMLQWFVNEQIEEEASVLKIVDTLKRVHENPAALFMLDRQLGERK